MAEEKESTSVPLSQAENGEHDPEDPVKCPPTSSNSSTRQVTDLFGSYLRYLLLHSLIFDFILFIFLIFNF